MAYYYQQQPPVQQDNNNYYYQQQQQQQQPQYGYYDQQQQQQPQTQYYYDNNNTNTGGYQQQQHQYYQQDDQYFQQQQQEPDVQYIDVEGNPGDTVIVEQQPDGTIIQRRVSAAEKEKQISDPTKKMEVSAEDAVNFVHREKVQEGGANEFDEDLIANIANKWNVSPPKERRMKFLVSDLDATVRTSEKQVLKQQKQRDSSGAASPGDASLASTHRRLEDNDDDQAIAVIGVVDRPPNTRFSTSVHRVNTVLKPTRGSGFDKLRMEGRPVPPTQESSEQAASEFATCLDYFRAETANILQSSKVPPSRRFNHQQHQDNGFVDEGQVTPLDPETITPDLNGSFDAAHFDDVEVVEIDQRDRLRDELDNLRDQLIGASNAVIHAHERLKKEGQRASEATQLVAHRQAPIRNNVSPSGRGKRGNSPVSNSNFSRTSTTATGAVGQVKSSKVLNMKRTSTNASTSNNKEL